LHLPLNADVSEEDYKSLPAGSADPRDEEVIPMAIQGIPYSNFIEVFLALHVVVNSGVQVPLLKNIYWKELLVLAYVWVAFLIVQIIKVVKLLYLVSFSASVTGMKLWVLKFVYTI